MTSLIGLPRLRMREYVDSFGLVVEMTRPGAEGGRRCVSVVNDVEEEYDDAPGGSMGGEREGEHGMHRERGDCEGHGGSDRSLLEGLGGLGEKRPHNRLGR